MRKLLPRPFPASPGWLLLPLLLGSCASGPGEFFWRPERPVGWPSGEDPPRIGLEFAYHGSRDVRRHRGFFREFFDFLFGSEVFELVSPRGLALLPGKRLLIADPGQGVVHRLSLVTGEHEIFKGEGELRLDTPVGVAPAPGGGFFVTDSARVLVVRFSRHGEPIGSFGNPEEMGRPTGIAYDRERNRLLVVDTLRGRILVYGLDGKLRSVHGKRGSGIGEFNYPTYLALGKDGSILVTDSLNFRIQILTPELKPIRTFGIPGRGPGTFVSAKGVAMDSEGHIYVVDGLFDNIQIFNQEGELLLPFGGRGTGLGRLYLPTGILIDEEDRIIVSDSGNARIQVYRFHSRKGTGPAATRPGRGKGTGFRKARRIPEPGGGPGGPAGWGRIGPGKKGQVLVISDFRWESPEMFTEKDDPGARRTLSGREGGGAWSPSSLPIISGGVPGLPAQARFR